MHSFKKIISSALCFILVITSASFAMIASYMNSDYDIYSDTQYRNELAGSIDTLFLGASHGLRAFNPCVIDNILSTNSYTFGGPFMTWHGREMLLMEEIDRNPLKRVFIEISYDTLQRPNSNGVEGNKTVLLRVNGTPKKLKYFFKETSLKEYDDMYSLFMLNSFEYIKGMFTGKKADDGAVKSTKGFYCEKTPNNILMNDDEQAELYNSKLIDENLDKENLNTLDRMVKECRQRGIEVYFIVTPISEREVWTYSNWDFFEETLAQLSQKYNCKCYDFCRLKSRFEYFSDETSFFDNLHLCGESGNTFSEIFGEIMLKEFNGEDISSLFYSSYNEMKQDFPYMKQLSSL